MLKLKCYDNLEKERVAKLISQTKLASKFLRLIISRELVINYITEIE